MMMMMILRLLREQRNACDIEYFDGNLIKDILVTCSSEAAEVVGGRGRRRGWNAEEFSGKSQVRDKSAS